METYKIRKMLKQCYGANNSSLTWVGAIPELKRFVLILNEILNMAHLMMNGHKIFQVSFGAHLDSEMVWTYMKSALPHESINCVLYL